MQQLLPVRGKEVEGVREGVRSMLAVERLQEATSRSSRAGGKGEKGDRRRGKRRRKCEGPSLVIERWQFVIS